MARLPSTRLAALLLKCVARVYYVTRIMRCNAVDDVAIKSNQSAAAAAVAVSSRDRHRPTVRLTDSECTAAAAAAADAVS